MPIVPAVRRARIVWLRIVWAAGVATARRASTRTPRNEGVEAGGLFHQDQGHGLHEMVLHHVFHGAGGVVVGGPAFEGKALQPADVDTQVVEDSADQLPAVRRQGDQGQLHVGSCGYVAQ